MRSRKWKSKLSKLLLILQISILSVYARAGEWRLHEGSIKGKQHRIELLEEELRGQIRQKNRTEDAQKLQAITGSMVVTYEKIKKLLDEKRDELKHMRYRHPEKGQQFDDNYYKTYEVKSLQDYEDEFGISGKLNSVKEKIHLHYGIKEDPEKAAENPKRKKEKKDKFEEKIILRQ